VRYLTLKEARRCETAEGPVCRCRCQGAAHGRLAVGADKQYKLFSELDSRDPHYRPRDECDGDSPTGKHVYLLNDVCRYCNQPKRKANGQRKRSGEVRLVGWILDEDSSIGLRDMDVQITVKDFTRSTRTAAGGFFSFGVRRGARVKIVCRRIDLEEWVTIPNDPSLTEIDYEKLTGTRLECPSN
jgi:hypothetical protein